MGPTTRRVLFIGNSLTYYNGGVERIVQGLWHASNSTSDNAVEFEFKSVTQGGFPLSKLIRHPQVLATLNTQKFDDVVVQEDMPETTIATFMTEAAAFIKLIRDHGARPLFYMAWGYQRLPTMSDEMIEQAHKDVCSEYKVDVAPVVVARRLAVQLSPKVDQWADDREHPSFVGTYLAGCTIYAAMRNQSPVGLKFFPSKLPGLDPIDTDVALSMQQIAESCTPPKSTEWAFSQH